MPSAAVTRPVETILEEREAGLEPEGKDEV